MKVKDFIKEFSHNNELYVENENNYRMEFYYNNNDHCTRLMDWEVELSNLREETVIGIANVLDSDGRIRAITLRVKTKATTFYAIPEIASQGPLWFENKVLGTNKEGGSAYVS